MARRRSTDSSSAALAFASSNATLNAFLGGRQRPWMHGGELPPPVENNQHIPPPRPLAASPKIDTRNEPSSSTPPALAGTQPPTPHTSTRTNRNTSAAAARNEASPSTSPALANLQPPHSIQPPNNSTSEHHTSFDILPSPTPSDDCNRVDNPVGGAEVDVLRDQGNTLTSQATTQGFPQATTQGFPQATTQGFPQATTQGFPQTTTQGFPQAPVPASAPATAPAPAPAPAQLQPSSSETAPNRPTHMNTQHPNKRLRIEDNTPVAISTLPSISLGTTLPIRREPC